MSGDRAIECEAYSRSYSDAAEECAERDAADRAGVVTASHGGKRAGSGRKPLPAGTARSRSIAFSVTPAEGARLDAWAAAEGRSLASLVADTMTGVDMIGHAEEVLRGRT